MTRQEAVEECVYLKSLFPSMAVESSDYWREKFEKYGHEAVRRSINKMADQHSDFVDRAGLLAELETQSGRGQGSPESRTRDAIQESSERRRNEREALERAKMSFGEIDRSLRGISVADLEELKAGVLAQLPEGTAKLLELSDVTTGKALRYHMAQALKGMTPA